MDSDKSSRSKKVVGLFLAAALSLTPGCAMNPFEWWRNEPPCTDLNRDGYCDEDGRPVSREPNRVRRTSFLPFFRSYSGSSGSKTSVSSPSGSSRGVSSGSKSGIGSSSRSGGSSSG